MGNVYFVCFFCVLYIYGGIFTGNYVFLVHICLLYCVFSIIYGDFPFTVDLFCRCAQSLILNLSIHPSVNQESAGLNVRLRDWNEHCFLAGNVL
jgi:hypothetical protein